MGSRFQIGHRTLSGRLKTAKLYVSQRVGLVWGGAAGPSPPPPALHGAPHHHGFLGWKKVAVIPTARWHGVPQAGAVGGLSSQVCPGSPDLVLGPEMQLFGASVHLGVTAEPAPTELGPGWCEPGWYCKGVL